MDKMAKKVEVAGGVPAAGDGAGTAIWCVPCGKLQPLAKAFDLFPWNKHVGTEAHKGSARMRGALQAAPPQGAAGGATSGARVWQRILPAAGTPGAVARDAKVEGGPPCRVNMRKCSKIVGANH